jgi:hypothetical protein
MDLAVNSDEHTKLIYEQVEGEAKPSTSPNTKKVNLKVFHFIISTISSQFNSTPGRSSCVQ